MSAAAVRKKLKAQMQATLADNAAHHDWDYREIRPVYTPPRPWHPDEHVVGDCGKGVQFNCWWVPGCPDPMGMNFGPYGNSQTICFHLPHLSSIAELQVGDPVTSGRDGNQHAAQVLEAGPDPLMWSFGHRGAPNTYRLSWDRREHQFLRLMHDDPAAPPTEVEILRAKTTWFAWMAWQLGEGHWAHYGRRNPAVRPNVGKVIAVSHPGWLLRERRYLANRHKGTPASREIVAPT